MKTLTIKLNQKYKSFPIGFVTNIDNNGIVVISGVNGSGKSQLMNIINGRRIINNESHDISREITIDTHTIKSDEIEYRSFKNSIKILP
ncbi:ATP-binding cassette domain-containing protein [Francisella orientalis]|uniref:ATP-binding cassette domain-containing protein n=1 Tax=Francisella orientalis TaxID=299583 RepID=A0AAP6XBB6_9GAMM|nr:ATP-binding cassette domain-containing protein [Francisella orientalis]AHB99031.1 hypothetical protein M973_00285 [Francisella orientalis LADL 07-285A]AKN86357.1 hypothetical protein FNO12_1890 [Francisella orientalis FNO12]AKN87895.1 Hypothetical protein FNO24_1892 [Francisella orientalis FNO24]AKN89434.1 Hypothetical protein FNO190_1890 [Francisella orientalis]AKU06193.1 Hypothetical protein FNO01_1890 [Francisella orientalis]